MIKLANNVVCKGKHLHLQTSLKSSSNSILLRYTALALLSIAMNDYPTHVPHANILIVDDTPDNLRLLSTMLVQQGYRVRSAISGQLALNAVQVECPDLILLDINMPQMNGYEVCHRLKTDPNTSQIPVIFISVLDDTIDKVKAFVVGGVDYITKPFQVEEVLARVNSQLSLRHLQKQLKTLNSSLEQEVEVRTTELQTAFSLESTLKQIIGKVRESLDEAHILQTVVQELTLSMGLDGCTAAVYDPERRTSTIHHEYTGGNPYLQKRVIDMASYPQVYHCLLEGLPVQFCLLESKQGTYSSILACPLIDIVDEQVLGDLWLFDYRSDRTFSEQDVRLIRQVAHQCAIALHQARLFQSVQAQVKKLEKMNQLKDDFLSTISHELRTPMANIKMATEMLEITLEPLGVLDPETSLPSRYFKILKEECQRETQLINDLLDLSRLNAGCEPLILTTLRLQDWIPHIAEVFAERTRNHEQVLHVHIPDYLAHLTTDFCCLERVLTELLNNACKYTPAHETIAIAADHTETGVSITISNSGVEIPEYQLEQLFEKFYRVPSHDVWKDGGSGLGLPLVKRRVELLHGHIQVNSNSGWTNFIIELPWNIMPTS
jgi:signal transduction histidine kinase/DNA-binding response OmpR family regulator